MKKFFHPFFLGLILMLVSFFLSAIKIIPKVGDRTELQDFKISLTISDIAFGGAPTVSGGGITGEFIRSSQDAALKSFGTPRLFGYNYVIIFVLATWGILIFVLNDRLRDSNKLAIAFGIAGLFLLHILVMMYELNYYKGLLFQDKLSEYLEMRLGPGFYLFIAAIIAVFAGAFKQFDIWLGRRTSSGPKLKPVSP